MVSPFDGYTTTMFSSSSLLSTSSLFFVLISVVLPVSTSLFTFVSTHLLTTATSSSSTSIPTVSVPAPRTTSSSLPLLSVALFFSFPPANIVDYNSLFFFEPTSFTSRTGSYSPACRRDGHSFAQSSAPDDVSQLTALPSSSSSTASAQDTAGPSICRR